MDRMPHSPPDSSKRSAIEYVWDMRTPALHLSWLCAANGGFLAAFVTINLHGLRAKVVPC